MVTAWIEKRASLGIDPSHRVPLLCLPDGSPIESSYIRTLLPRLARIAGIRKRVHAHGLRHTHAAELRAEGVEVGIISKQLGHASIATTAVYLDHIQPLRVVEAIRQRAWRDEILGLPWTRRRNDRFDQKSLCLCPGPLPGL